MRDHRSLKAWQDAREITHVAFSACRCHWKAHGAALFEQLQRAALSAQLNIAEGYAQGSKRRFSYHLRIAYGSTVETAELLRTGVEEGLLPENQITPVLERSDRCQAFLLALIKKYGS